MKTACSLTAHNVLSRAQSHLAPISKRPSEESPTQTNAMLAVLGHELRNPLSALSCALEAWPESMDDSELMYELLHIMRRQVTQLTRLTDDLLDTARLVQGRLVVKKELINLSFIISDACEEVKPYFDRRDHVLEVRPPEVPLVLFGDASRLIQAFANILQNAAKFTSPRGHITVSLSRKGYQAVVSIRDNGIGICPRAMPNLLRESSSDKRSPDTGNDGLGIGLRLVKTIVDLHGGSLEVHSAGLGLGSEVSVKLPLAFVADDPDLPHDEKSDSSIKSH